MTKGMQGECAVHAHVVLERAHIVGARVQDNGERVVHVHVIGERVHIVWEHVHVVVERFVHLNKRYIKLVYINIYH